jgi:hypothetical protein
MTVILDYDLQREMVTVDIDGAAVQMTAEEYENNYGIGIYQMEEQHIMYDDVRGKTQAIIDAEIEQVEERLEKIVRRAEAGAIKPGYANARKKALQKELDHLVEQKDKLVERDGARIAMRIIGDRFEVEDTILFKRTYGSRTALQSKNGAYTFAAVMVAANLWYITGRQASRGMTWDELVTEHLWHAWEETGEIWVATEWHKVLKDD